jgi:hypothetical protein
LDGIPQQNEGKEENEEGAAVVTPLRRISALLHRMMNTAGTRRVEETIACIRNFSKAFILLSS